MNHSPVSSDIWTNFSLEKKRRKKARFVASLFSLIGIVLIGAVIWFVLPVLHLSKEDAGQMKTIAAPAYQSGNSEAKTMGNSYTSTLQSVSVETAIESEEIFGEADNRAAGNALTRLLFARDVGNNTYAKVSSDPPPSFVSVAPHYPAGPQQIALMFSDEEQVQEYPVGVASFSRSEVSGIAGEWRVRPWTRPAWIPESADCGDPGTVVIGGHVSWYTQPGPFYDLAALQEGDQIHCQDAAGTWYVYEVSARWRTDYNDTVSYLLPPQEGETESVLNLYSCTREVRGVSVIRAQLVPGATEEQEQS